MKKYKSSSACFCRVPNGHPGRVKTLNSVRSLEYKILPINDRATTFIVDYGPVSSTIKSIYS